MKKMQNVFRMLLFEFEEMAFAFKDLIFQLIVQQVR